MPQICDEHYKPRFRRRAGRWRASVKDNGGTWRFTSISNIIDTSGCVFEILHPQLVVR